MNTFLPLALALAIIILFAKAGGYISLRLGQPSVLGELFVGIILGPSVIDMVHLPYFEAAHVGQTVKELAEFGVLLLMFIAGLDLHLSDLIKSGKVAALAGTFGVLAPLLLWFAAGLGLGMTPEASIFVGLILAATSVSISAQTLMELRVLRSRVGVSMLGAAVFDDILVVLGLSIFLAIVAAEGGGSLFTILILILQMALFLILAAAAGWYILPRLSRRVADLPISRGAVAFTVITILLYGWASEVFGHMAAITGAFLAGVMLARSPVRERIESGISALAYGMFVPIFFINVGLSANARELLGETFWLFISMTVLAVIGKLIGAGLGGKLGGLSTREALQLAVGMTSRGEVGLIIASVGITEGLIRQDTFSAVVGMVIITTLITPPLLRFLFVRFPTQESLAAQQNTAKQVSTLTEGEGK